MTRIRQFILAILLTSLLTCSALGGEPQTPGIAPEPPPVAAEGEPQTPGIAATCTDVVSGLVLDFAAFLVPLV